MLAICRNEYSSLTIPRIKSLVPAIALFAVCLAIMVHRVETRVADDDWAAITTKAERKKLQNRINQRAHRRRKNQQDQPIPYSKTNEGAGVVLRQRFFKLSNTSTERPKKQPKPQPGTPVVRYELQIELLHDSIRTAQRPDLYPVPLLPLSADHQLLTLVHYNVYRGLYHNKLLVKGSTNFTCAYIPMTINLNPGHILPPSLTPTIAQQTIPHQTWIDVFPSPVGRENLILELMDGGSRREFDAIDLFKDLHGVFTAGTEYYLDPTKDPTQTSGDDAPEMQPNERKGLIVWGDASNPLNWEVTEGFLQKWAWMLRGCTDLMAGTNKWRALRDEPPLYW